MTRMIVYSVALGVFVAATVMTITSILTPNWVTYTVSAENTNATFSHHMGLHQSCSSTADPNCRRFPDDDDCRGDQFFCSMWRSSGFLMSFATIVELATAVSFVVVMAGGKYKREEGWKLIGGLLLADAVIEFFGMGLIAYLFDHDQMFTVPGWKLDYSWILCTVSASVSVLLAIVLGTSAYLLPPEDDYEYLEDPIDDV
ncbi:uncharacterized protein BCR38DRAFT_341706 [Pseudomassariella vexata]|uniref:Pre-mRNA splicing factor n=1 Tax=Pseudomassariella vexata TaxID=1141098 RepID=A0A1Y2E1M8_9PEZI|nr:uncharacterized protein BCR38DRAFT_341706 [Pseudomassariella vexata]ORY65254.1 hypothetical protein BCR38DRAFT_341706 [Pseudomassariella vexata]